MLTLLTNPLNVTLLASQLLSAPAIWHAPDGLFTTLQVLDVFKSAAFHLRRLQEDTQYEIRYPSSGKLGTDEWVTAVIRGADERSPRWRHVIVFAGLLLGFGDSGRRVPSSSMHTTMKSALVKAASLALHESDSSDELAANSIVVLLSQTFHLLTGLERFSLNLDEHLPDLQSLVFNSREGLYSGYFLSLMDADIIEGANKKFNWSIKSPSWNKIRNVANGPVMPSLGASSRLLAFAVENAQDVEQFEKLMEHLLLFTRSLQVQWRQNKFSEIDPSEESFYLDAETLQTTLPLLWQVLKSSMFAILVVLQSVIARVLRDTEIPFYLGM